MDCQVLMLYIVITLLQFFKRTVGHVLFFKKSHFYIKIVVIFSKAVSFRVAGCNI